LEEAESQGRASLRLPLQPYRFLDSRGGLAALALADDLVRPQVGRVIGLGASRPVEAETLDEILEYFDAIGADYILIPVPPTARPSSLPRLLNARGFRPAFREAIIYFETSTQGAVDSFTRIREATPEDSAALLDLLIACGLTDDRAAYIVGSLGAAGWHYYVALDGSQPVAFANFFVSSRSAWLTPGLTLPDHRLRGYQRALAGYCIAEARRLGCAWVTTNAHVARQDGPGLSLRSFTRMGFQLLYVRTTYLWQRTGAPPLSPFVS
jgi:GNAT superfamily N-acetyltransferase